MSVKVIIFSKDRACQLDALLTSLRNLAIMDPIGSQSVVLWTASNAEYGAGYAHCMSDNSNVRFVRERDFAADVDDLLPDDGYVCFFVDDDVMHKRVNFQHPVYELDKADALLCFSLRLGLNCAWCYPHDCEQEMPLFHSPRSILTWNWTTDGSHDWRYPMSLDGTVFRVADIRWALEGASYVNPNTLEDALARRASIFARMRPKMACYPESHVTGIPANVVTTTHQNRYGDRGKSAEVLNLRYRSGDRIQPASMSFDAIDAAHCEIEYTFI